MPEHLVGATDDIIVRTTNPREMASGAAPEGDAAASAEESGLPRSAMSLKDPVDYRLLEEGLRETGRR